MIREQVTYKEEEDDDDIGKSNNTGQAIGLKAKKGSSNLVQDRTRFGA